MLLLKPFTVKKLWGDRLLLDWCAEECGEPIGQVLTACAKPGEASTVVGGEFDGWGFDRVWAEHRELFGWGKTDDFPLIIAFVHASDNLSLQVHPNNKWALELEGATSGKEESWVFYESPGFIVGGSKCARDEVEGLIAVGRWSDIYDMTAVNKGDYVHVIPGTLHAMTKGCFVYEIQQSSDYTYRFYDYDRVDVHGNRRPLALEKALSVLDVSLVPECRPFVPGELFAEKTYGIMQRSIDGDQELSNDGDSFLCCTVTKGALECDNGPAKQGMSIILFPHETIKVTGKADVMLARPY